MDSHAHPPGQQPVGCPQCIVPQSYTRSAKFAWAVAGVAIALLLAVLFLGVGSAGGTALAAVGGAGLLAVLACPISMGVMMWFMMRKR